MNQQLLLFKPPQYLKRMGGALGFTIFWACFFLACRTAVNLPQPTTVTESDPPTITAAAVTATTPLPEPVLADDVQDNVEVIEPTHTPSTAASSPDFDGNSAFDYLESQLAFGPDRWPGSKGHQQTGDFIVAQLAELQWQVEVQPFIYNGVAVRNIIGKANIGRGSVIIIGAHYDTRRVADQTPGAAAQGLAVPGAVDGASGVAVLLELARTLNLDVVPHEIWLAFFDAEDNGNNGIEGWDWIAGSQYMADNLVITPEAMVLVDMVGDADQQLYYEGNSDATLRAELWQIADSLGHGEHFIPELGHTMIDDHVPFARLGIPAVDIIDFDYPYWHTVEDTADKASPESLWRVGQTLEFWLENGRN